MKIKLIEDTFPENYAQPRPFFSLEKTKIIEGKLYMLLGKSEKRYLCGQRVWNGILALAKTILTLGIGIFFERIRSDWKSFFTGKKIVAIYCSSFSATKILADKGYAVAQFNLGIMYKQGNGVQLSNEDAVRNFGLSADQGNADGQNSLGTMYELGLGLQQSYEKAVECYRLAADQGNPDGQSNLGTMYRLGQGVQKSIEKAVDYYRLAADQGHSVAQYVLRYVIGKEL